MRKGHDGYTKKVDWKSGDDQYQAKMKIPKEEKQQEKPKPTLSQEEV